MRTMYRVRFWCVKNLLYAFRALRFSPDGQVLMQGVVTHRAAIVQLEHITAWLGTALLAFPQSATAIDQEWVHVLGQAAGLAQVPDRDIKQLW